MKEIKAPDCYDHSPSVRTLFVAGGITNCGDWQKAVPIALKETNIDILNPRRDDFDMCSPIMEQEQIEWEHQHILQASAYMFWFCEETLCPITLYELGKVAGLFPTKRLFIGTHQNYKRKRDINFQMQLLRPEVDVVQYLDKLLGQVTEWAKEPFHRHLCP